MEQPLPDTKDWTWVLDRPCPECGFRADAIDRDQIGALMRANAAGFRTALQRRQVVAQRPPVPAGSPPRWSALEYAGHVADVYQLADERLNRMLKKKHPTFADWDQNAAAVEGAYAEADPDKVAYRLAAAAGKVADLVDKTRGDRWERTGARSDGASFTVESFAVYILHDVSHHLWDVEEGYRRIAEQARKEAKKAAEQAAERAADEGGEASR